LDAKNQSLISNNTWKLEGLLPNWSMVTCKLFFKCKYHANGTLAKYEAQLVARRFFQIGGLNYGETFFPLVKFISICTLIFLIALMIW
jgi:hypothetical protein